MREPEISAFLNHLATDGRVSASTQNQALHALLFLNRHILGRDMVSFRALHRQSVGGGCRGGALKRDSKACDLPLVSTLLRDAFAGKRF